MLVPEVMLPGLIEAFSVPVPSGAITGVKVVNVISQYLATGQNAAFGNYITWAFPFPQMIEAFSVHKPAPELFATSFSNAVIQGLSGLYTLFQINALQAAGPVMLPMVMMAARMHAPTSVPFATAIAYAVHAQATSIIITVSDPKTLGAPYPGPFF